jgi:hypothetical protein
LRWLWLTLRKPPYDVREEIRNVVFAENNLDDRESSSLFHIRECVIQRIDRFDPTKHGLVVSSHGPGEQPPVPTWDFIVGLLETAARGQGAPMTMVHVASITKRSIRAQGHCFDRGELCLYLAKAQRLLSLVWLAWIHRVTIASMSGRLRSAGFSFHIDDPGHLFASSYPPAHDGRPRYRLPNRLTRSPRRVRKVHADRAC